MLLSCPNCATSYEVDRASLGSTGRSVRCLRCRHIWFASNAMAFADIANAHRADVVAMTGGTPVAEPQDEAPVPYYTNVAPPPASGDAGHVSDATLGEEITAGESPIATLPASETAGAGTYGSAADTLAAVSFDELPVVETTDTASLAPGDDVSFPPRTGDDDRTAADDIETVAARRNARAAKRQRTRSLQGLTTAILVLLAIITGLVAWRSDIVGVMPQTASLYAAIGMPVNLRGLEFANVKTTSEAQGGVPVLVVVGEIVSTSRHAVEVPRIRFAVRNESGKEIYAWTALPSRTVLTPGATLPFRSRLASPPPESHQVLVRFFNRRDLAAGLP